jgi:hypothetical protein
MRPLAILCSDLHFSQTAPAARSAEPDWYAAQGRYIDQLTALQMRCTPPQDGWPLPIVVAGDIFDRWTPMHSPAELINFLIERLPDRMFAIPGQHDLPTHRYEERGRSPYATLAMANKIEDIVAGQPRYIPFAPYNGLDNPALVLHPFPWGHEITPYTGDKKSGEIHLAVVHSYIWTKNCSYPGAPEEKQAETYRPKLVGYDAAVFGDNHIGFMLGSRIINCGTFMRRKSDEKTYRPMVGILYDDRHIEPHYLDVSADLWLDDAPSRPEEDQAADTSGVIAALRQLGSDALDFRAVLRQLMDQRNTGQRVRGVVASVIS